MSNKEDTHPRWTSTPPKEGTYRSIFKWGAPDGFKHPNKRLYAMLKEKLQMSDADFAEKKKEGNEVVTCKIPKKLSDEHIGVFKKIVGDGNVAADDFSRVKYSHGKTMEETMKLRDGIVEDVPDIVVHPRHKDDVQQIVQYSNKH